MTKLSNAFARGPYLARVTTLTAIVSLYPSIAVFGPQQGRNEFYPFFHWSLFSESREMREDWVVRVIEIDGETLAQPTLFFDMPDRFDSARARSPSFMKLLDKFAVAHVLGEREREEDIAAQIEQVYFNPVRSLRYEIAAIRYHPLRRLETGEIDAVNVIAERSFSR